jgi:hypothetical protein
MSHSRELLVVRTDGAEYLAIQSPKRSSGRGNQLDMVRRSRTIPREAPRSPAKPRDGRGGKIKWEMSAEER